MAKIFEDYTKIWSVDSDSLYAKKDELVVELLVGSKASCHVNRSSYGDSMRIALWPIKADVAVCDSYAFLSPGNSTGYDQLMSYNNTSHHRMEVVLFDKSGLPITLFPEKVITKIERV